MKVISIFVAMLLITVYPVGNKWKETSCTVFEDKIHEVNKIGLIGFEDAKIQNYYVNAFCMVAGYGALCFQLKLRNLPLFISLFPLGIFLPELFTPMWLLLTAGPRFFMGAEKLEHYIPSCRCFNSRIHWYMDKWITRCIFCRYSLVYSNSVSIT